MNNSSFRFRLPKLAGRLAVSIRSRMQQPEIINRFLKLASWTMIAFALDKAAMLIVVFLLARLLGAPDYGRLTLTQGLVNTAQIFVVLGAGTVLARYVPALRQESVRRAVEVINLCALVVLAAAVVFTAGALLGAPTIAQTVIEVSTASPIPYLMIVWVLLTVVNSLLLAIVLSFEKGRAMGLVSLITALMSVIIVPLLSLHFGLLGAVSALIGVEVVKAALLVMLYRRLLSTAGVSMFTPARREDTPLLWQFGFPVFLNAALWAPIIWLAQYIIKTQAPDGLLAVGVFGFANNLLGAVILVSGLTNRAALPILSSLHSRGAYSELRRMTWLLTLAQAGAAAVIATPLAALAPSIMVSAGPGFAPHWPVLVVMIVTGVIVSGQTPLGNYLLVEQRPYFIVLTLVPWAAILLGAASAYASYGAYALAWGLLLASITRTVLFYWGWLSSAPSTDHE